MRENLKKARNDAGMTQQQVAEYLKVSIRHYKYIEAGTIVGNFNIWDALEDLFNIHQRVLRENYHAQVDNQ